MINLKTPIYSDDVKDLKAGDVISITGTIYTARDRLINALLMTANLLV